MNISDFFECSKESRTWGLAPGQSVVGDVLIPIISASLTIYFAYKAWKTQEKAFEFQKSLNVFSMDKELLYTSEGNLQLRMRNKSAVTVNIGAIYFNFVADTGIPNKEYLNSQKTLEGEMLPKPFSLYARSTQVGDINFDKLKSLCKYQKERNFYLKNIIIPNLSFNEDIVCNIPQDILDQLYNEERQGEISSKPK